MINPEEQYSEYVENCQRKGETPLSFEAWFAMAWKDY